MNQRGFVIPPFLLSPTGIMAVLIVALSLSNVIFISLYRSTTNEYAKFQADVLATNEQIGIDNERKQTEAERAVLDVSVSWKRALDYSRRNPVVRVLQPHCDSGTSAQATGTGLKPDGTAVAGLSSTAVNAPRCEELINRGVQDAAQVLHLQADRAALCKTYGCE